jgi:hypothetical protein
LPIDIAFGVEVEGKKEPSTKYVKTMKERLKKAYELASRATRTAQERQKCPFGFFEFSSSGRNPIGRRRFLYSVLFRPSPFSR